MVTSCKQWNSRHPPLFIPDPVFQKLQVAIRKGHDLPRSLPISYRTGIPGTGSPGTVEICQRVPEDRGRRGRDGSGRRRPWAHPARRIAPARSRSGMALWRCIIVLSRPGTRGPVIFPNAQVSENGGRVNTPGCPGRMWSGQRSRPRRFLSRTICPRLRIRSYHRSPYPPSRSRGASPCRLSASSRRDG